MQSELEKVIEVKNVRKVYRMGSEKICAVDGVDFEIYKGEFCCLLGTSGSGKSTLLNLMAGIEKTTTGQIIIKGKNIHRMSENNLARFRQRYLGFVFQSYNLMNSMTALENVEFPLVFKRVRRKKRKKLASEMLIKVGLEKRLNHKPKEMSGGQQQRVGIARAFVAKPEIVFADEPTGNLDTKTTMEVMNLIKEIARTNNQTIVMVTHDRRLAEFADKIIHILDGKIQSIEISKDTQEQRYQAGEQISTDEQAKQGLDTDIDTKQEIKPDIERKSEINIEEDLDTKIREEIEKNLNKEDTLEKEFQREIQKEIQREIQNDTKNNVENKTEKEEEGNNNE